MVCKVSYINVSVTGWDRTFTPARSRVPILYVPIPPPPPTTCSGTDGRKRRRRRRRGGEKQKAMGPLSSSQRLLSFSLSLYTSGWPEGFFQKGKCVHRESEALSGGKCTTTAEARAFPCISPGLPAHTCLYIFIASTKPSLYRGLLHIRKPAAEHGNKKSALENVFSSWSYLKSV